MSEDSYSQPLLLCCADIKHSVSSLTVKLASFWKNQMLLTCKFWSESKWTNPLNFLQLSRDIWLVISYTYCLTVPRKAILRQQDYDELKLFLIYELLFFKYSNTNSAKILGTLSVLWWHAFTVTTEKVGTAVNTVFT